MKIKINNQTYYKELMFLLFTLIILIFLILDLIAADDTVTQSGNSGNTVKIEQVDIAGDFYFLQEGKTSWYGKRFHNRKTSSGEHYDMYGLTAAHKTLPFGTIVRVKNTENNKSTLLRVNDRGPFVKSKILDLSYSSAQDIEAFDNPQIKIEALLPNSFLFMNKQNDDYYFGYSFDYPLVCLPSNVIKFLDAANDFDEAVEIYKDYCSNFPDKFVYLMVPAGDRKFKMNSEEKDTFYICLFDSNSNEFAKEGK